MILRVALIQRSISALCDGWVQAVRYTIYICNDDAHKARCVAARAAFILGLRACGRRCARDGRVRRSVHEHTYLSVLVDSLPLALSIPCVGCGIDPQTSRFYHSVSYNLNKTLCNGAGGLVPCGCLARLASFLGPHQ